MAGLQGRGVAAVAETQAWHAQERLALALDDRERQQEWPAASRLVQRDEDRQGTPAQRARAACASRLKARGLRHRLEQIGHDVDLSDPSTKACFPCYCASDHAGFCACSLTEHDCAPAVETGLAPACMREPVDICTSRSATTR